MLFLCFKCLPYIVSFNIIVTKAITTIISNNMTYLQYISMKITVVELPIECSDAPYHRNIQLG